MGYRLLPHTADLRAVLEAPDRAGLYQAAVDLVREVVAGDSPMLRAASVERLLAEFAARRPACLLGTAHKDNPGGLGRIVRDAAGNFAAIVEERDATPDERQITEVNMSTYLFDAQQLLLALDKLRPNNKQGEYYITDAPGILKGEGKRVAALAVLKPVEALSINTVDDLAAVEAALREEGRGEE